jgi:hypothetical protein
VLDKPIALPNGTEVELVPLDEVLANGWDYLDDEERERFHQSIGRSLEDVRAGRTASLDGGESGGSRVWRSVGRNGGGTLGREGALLAWWWRVPVASGCHELPLDQPPIGAVLSHEGGVTADLNDPATIQHHHAIGADYRREPVGDD